MKKKSHTNPILPKTNINAMQIFVNQFVFQKNIALETLDAVEFEELSLSPFIHFQNDKNKEINIEKINSNVYIISALTNNYSKSCIIEKYAQLTDSNN